MCNFLLNLYIYVYSVLECDEENENDNISFRIFDNNNYTQDKCEYSDKIPFPPSPKPEIDIRNISPSSNIINNNDPSPRLTLHLKQDYNIGHFLFHSFFLDY